jgi:UDP-N-acetylglucosamine 2-epimerase (non-hydrolysing)
LALTASSKFALTDSGGLQEETTSLGIPCLTLRPCTERPVTVSVGTNTVVGSDSKLLQRTVEDILTGHGKLGEVPELWDGQAGIRAARVLMDHFARIPVAGA